MTTEPTHGDNTEYLSEHPRAEENIYKAMEMAKAEDPLRTEATKVNPEAAEILKTDASKIGDKVGRIYQVNPDYFRNHPERIEDFERAMGLAIAEQIIQRASEKATLVGEHEVSKIILELMPRADLKSRITHYPEEPTQDSLTYEQYTDLVKQMKQDIQARFNPEDIAVADKVLSMTDSFSRVDSTAELKIFDPESTDRLMKVDYISPSGVRYNPGGEYWPISTIVRVQDFKIDLSHEQYPKVADRILKIILSGDEYQNYLEREGKTLENLKDEYKYNNRELEDFITLESICDVKILFFPVEKASNVSAANGVSAKNQYIAVMFAPPITSSSIPAGIAIYNRITERAPSFGRRTYFND